MRRMLFYIAIMWFAGACSLSTDVDIKLPTQHSYYVVESILRKGRPIDLSLVQSVRMDDQLIYNFVWNAKVSVSYDGQSVPLMGFLFCRAEDNVMINYTSNVVAPYETGKTIKLLIRTDTAMLSASTVVPPSFRLKESKIEKGVIKIAVDGSEDFKNQYYSIVARFYKPDAKFGQVSTLYNKSESGESDQLLELNTPNYAYDSVWLSVKRIAPDYYRYLYSVDKAFDAYYDPFTIPMKISTNINGGLGVFTVVDEKIVTIKNPEKSLN